MINKLKSAALKVKLLFPWGYYRKSRRGAPLVFYLHGLGNSPFTDPIYTSPTLDALDSLVSWLESEFDHLDILEDLSSDKDLSGKFLITFDDGHKSCNAPLLRLRELGVPCALFVNPDFVTRGAYFERHMSGWLVSLLSKATDRAKISLVQKLFPTTNSLDDLAREIMSSSYTATCRIKEAISLLGFDVEACKEEFLTESELKVLWEAGVHIGAHGMDHKPFPHLDISQQLEQVESSVRWVYQKYPSNVKLFAFPYSNQGVGKNFYNSISNCVDAIFSTEGWVRRFQGVSRFRVYGRVGLDNPPSLDSPFGCKRLEVLQRIKVRSPIF